MSLNVMSYTLDPITNGNINMFLFRNVKNIDTIHSKIVNGEWKCAAVNAKLIVDPFQLVVAANKAAVAESSGSMVTKSIYTEILFNLSLSKNITQSLIKFGIDKSTDSIIICFISKHSNEEVNMNNVLSQIEGDLLSIEELNKVCDVLEVKKIYKLQNVQINDDDHLNELITSRIVTKSIVSY